MGVDFGIKHFLDFFPAHLVEVIGDVVKSLQSAQPLLWRFGRINRLDLDHGFSGLGDDEGLAFGGFFDEPREVGLGLVDIDRRMLATLN